jgi:DNA-binding HxlR family transcriptional regulator
VPEALAALAEGPLTSAELRRRTPIDKRGVALLRLEGLADVSVKEFVEDVPVRTRRLTYGLTVKGQRMMELLDALSEKGGADLLQVTSRQLECMRPLRKGRKTFEEIPGAEYTVLNGLVRRGLIDKRIVEVKVTRRLQRRKPVYTLTERGERAQEACRLIESL